MFPCKHEESSSDHQTAPWYQISQSLSHDTKHSTKHLCYLSLYPTPKQPKMTRRRTPYAALATILLTFLTLTSAKKKSRVKSGTRYNLHDPVHLVVNKVGPFNNPSETYRYYSFPFCKDHHVEAESTNAKDSARKGGEKHKLRFGESITGDRRETSPYEIDFQVRSVKTYSKASDIYRYSVIILYFNPCMFVHSIIIIHSQNINN